MTFEVKELQQEPWRWISIAAAIANDGYVPDEKLETALMSLDAPRVQRDTRSCEELWSVMQSTNRVNGLRWLDKTGLLGELLPCWNGLASRRKLRLDAVEMVHKESWKDDLKDEVYRAICDDLEVIVDSRLDRWALTALATLLAGGDTENQSLWTKEVRRNLFELSATESEITFVETIVRDYRKGIRYLRKMAQECNCTNALAVTCLSTILVGGEDTEDEYKVAAQIVNDALSGAVNPLDS